MKRGWRVSRIIAVAVMAGLILLMPAISRASGEPRCIKTAPSSAVCLTIDDGFNVRAIRSILQTLRKNHVKCTFFIVGAFLTRPGYQPLWQRAILDGNEICYHTMRHQRVSSMTKSQISADITAWEKAAHKALGDSYQIPKFARLPGGAGSFDPRVVKIYADCGYTVIRWSVDTLTGPESHDISIKSYVRSFTHPGSIILTHFGGADASALPRYIGWLKTNYSLIRLSDAFPAPVTPRPTKAISPLITDDNGLWVGFRGLQHRHPAS